MCIRQKHLQFISLLVTFLYFSYTPVSFSGTDSVHKNDTSVNHQQLDYPTITSALPLSFPPFYNTDSEGVPHGMAIDVMNEIDHHAGFHTKYTVMNTWQDVFDAIKSNQAQIIPNLGITEKRKNDYFFTVPYAQSDIKVFSLKNFKISSISTLQNLNIAVVKHNVGIKIAKKNKYEQVIIYDSIDLALTALIDGSADAIIYPKLIFNTKAAQLGLSDVVYDNDITLKVIHRAIAVSKSQPQLFHKLNKALKEYLSSDNFEDKYVTWYGEKPHSLSIAELIIINVCIFICSMIVFFVIWKKKIFSTIRKNTNLTWVVALISILITTTSIVSLSTLWILYETSFSEQRYKLIDSVKSRARLIESIAKNNFKNIERKAITKDEAYKQTIDQVIESHENFRWIDKTIKIVLGKRDNDKLHYVLRQQHSNLISPKLTPITSAITTPIHLALSGHSGTIIYKDYRSKKVLAAYEPVSIINLGLVAKVDLDKIRAPYIRSALFILMIVILVSFFGSLLFFYIMYPQINKIKETEQHFQQLFRNNRSVSLIVNPKNARILDANYAAINYYGYSVDDFSSYQLDILIPEFSIELVDQFNQSVRGDGTTLITQHRLHNGEVRDVEVFSDPVNINNETFAYLVITDITEKLKTKKQNSQLNKGLEQSRKMEALGQLTGGIAHDFNNMLGIIMGYTDLSLEKNTNEKITKYLKQITTASTRAKELIASMMLFSRTDEGECKAVDIIPLVKEDIKMLRSIIPTSIEIQEDIDSDLPDVSIEPVKLQQLIMNLCVNARDAMDNKGSLTIALKLIKDVDEQCLVSFKNITGDWLELSVTDTGTGMTQETVKQIFEPFFTTKDKDKGTGMGMSVVHGIVTQLNAHVLIDSEEGKGTNIRILFKPIYETKKVTTQAVTYSDDKLNNESILIVDDEESLAFLTSEMLTDHGYQCSYFSSPSAALSNFVENPEKFDLIISDQTMPELTGFEMIKKMREERANIPAIIVTGYSDNLDKEMTEKQSITLLGKPVAKDLLLLTIQKTLKSAKNSTSEK